MVQRNCSLEINNGSNTYTLANPQVFLVSGVCEMPPPPMLSPGATGHAFFTKSTGTARGAVGVLTYDLVNPKLSDYSQVLAVMFSVPFDRMMYSNWVAVGILVGPINCDYSLYDRMYYREEGGFKRAKGDGSSIAYREGYLVVKASMSDSVECVLQLDVNDTHT